MNQAGGYEKNYQFFLEALKRVDLKQASKILDLEFNALNQVIIPFMGKTYLATMNGINREDGQPAATIHGSILAGYLLCKGTEELAGKFVPLDQLTRTIPFHCSSFARNCNSRLAKLVENDLVEFDGVMKMMGGLADGVVGIGGKSWIIYLLPKIPVQLIFYEGDEMFPSVAKLLFDQNAVHFLEFEFLAVLSALFVNELEAISK